MGGTKKKPSKRRKTSKNRPDANSGSGDDVPLQDIATEQPAEGAVPFLVFDVACVYSDVITAGPNVIKAGSR